jgi:hypothetical protein
MATPNYDFGSVLSLKRDGGLKREEEGKETRRRIEGRRDRVGKNCEKGVVRVREQTEERQRGSRGLLLVS